MYWTVSYTHLVLERDQNQAVLRISNQVTHPEQINIDQVFERFYKADVARSKTLFWRHMFIYRDIQRKLSIRPLMCTDQPIILITDSDLRSGCLQDCRLATVRVQYGVVANN